MEGELCDTAISNVSFQRERDEDTVVSCGPDRRLIRSLNSNHHQACSIAGHATPTHDRDQVRGGDTTGLSSNFKRRVCRSKLLTPQAM